MASEPRAHVPTPPPFLCVFPSSLRDTCPPSGAPRATVEPDVASRKKHRLRFPKNGEDSHQIKGLAWHLKLVALTLAISLVRLSHHDVLHPLWNSQPNIRVVHLFWCSPKEVVLVCGPVLRMVQDTSLLILIPVTLLLVPILLVHTQNNTSPHSKRKCVTCMQSNSMCFQRAIYGMAECSTV